MKIAENPIACFAFVLVAACILAFALPRIGDFGVEQGWWYSADTRYQLELLGKKWDAEAELARINKELK